MATTTRKKAKVPQAPAAAPSAADAAQAYAEILIDQAKELERESYAVQLKINANRTELRLIDAQGNLSTSQGEWLDTWYPMKKEGERRSKEEVEATRKLREAARKDGND